MPNYTLKEKVLFGSVHINKKKLAKELQGKTVLITGASSGIGERLAYLLADTESHLILVARREEKLSGMKEDIEKRVAKVSIFRADLRNQEEMERLLAFLHTFHRGWTWSSVMREFPSGDPFSNRWTGSMISREQWPSITLHRFSYCFLSSRYCKRTRGRLSTYPPLICG